MALNNFINRTTKSPIPSISRDQARASITPTHSPRQNLTEAEILPSLRESTAPQLHRPFGSPVQSDFDHTVSEHSHQQNKSRVGTQFRQQNVLPGLQEKNTQKHATFANEPVVGTFSDDYEETTFDDDGNPQTAIFRAGLTSQPPGGSPQLSRAESGYQPPRRGSSIRHNMTSIEQVNADFARRKSPDHVSFGDRSPSKIRPQTLNYSTIQPALVRPRSEAHQQNRGPLVNGAGHFIGHGSAPLRRDHHNARAEHFYEFKREYAIGAGRQNDETAHKDGQAGASPAETGDDYDYPEETLRQMAYRDLKAQDFDSNPAHDPIELPGKLQEAGMAERMDYIRTMKSEGNFGASELQSRYFEGLPLSDWEEVGDWFIERFSKNLQSLQEHRKEMRREAQKFEDEIEQRFKLISDTETDFDRVKHGMLQHKIDLLSPGRGETLV